MSDEAPRRIVEPGSEAGALARDLVGAALADAPPDEAKAKARYRLEASLAHDGITTGVAALSSAAAARLVVPMLSPVEASHNAEGGALGAPLGGPVARRRDLSLPLAAAASISVLLVGSVIAWNVFRSNGGSGPVAMAPAAPPAPVAGAPAVPVETAPAPVAPTPPAAPAAPVAGNAPGTVVAANTNVGSGGGGAGGAAVPVGGGGGSSGAGGAAAAAGGAEPATVASAGAGPGHGGHVRTTHGAAHTAGGGGSHAASGGGALAAMTGASSACGARCHGDIACLLRCSTHGGAAASGGGAHASAGGGGDALAQSPSRDDVMSAMSAVRAPVATCHGRLTGMAPVAVTFASTGHVSNAAVGAPFSGTPQGQCIARAVGRAHVPRFSRPSFTVNFPFMIR